MAKGSRGGKRSVIPHGMSRDRYDRYRKDGFNDKEIQQIQLDTMAMREQIRKSEERRKREGDRPITSSTYERAMKRTANDASGWLTGGRGRK